MSTLMALYMHAQQHNHSNSTITTYVCMRSNISHYICMHAQQHIRSVSISIPAFKEPSLFEQHRERFHESASLGASMKRHRWELPESASSSHQWETLDDVVFGEFDASEDDANDEVEPTAWAAQRAAELFLESLLALFLTSKVSAESKCVICY